MGFRTAYPDRHELLKAFARENRHNQTLAESVMWNELRTNGIGYRFVRQHIIGDYIVDFVCLEEKLVVEVDGGYHAEREQQEDDAIRTAWLNSVGFHVIRFQNDEVMFETQKVLDKITNKIRELQISESRTNQI